MSGRINLDNISDDFKSYLQGLGLTEEQVNEAIKLFVGDKKKLQTNNKDSIVNAINENKTSISSLNSKTDATNSNLNNLQTRVNNGQNVKMTEDNGACRGIPSNDANNIETTGFWMGSNVANAPSGTHGWVYIESKVHNNLYQNQIATDLHNSEKRWTRDKLSGTWSEWRSL